MLFFEDSYVLLFFPSIRLILISVIILFFKGNFFKKLYEKTIIVTFLFNLI